MVKEEFSAQFDQTWSIFTEIVGSFPDDSWTSYGVGYVVPARVAYHALLGVEYYIEYKSNWGNRTGRDWSSMATTLLPSQEDIQEYAEDLSTSLNQWLSRLDLDAENKRFEWAGKTQSGVLIFLLRHTMYHIGELNGLLYALTDGTIDDMWMKGFHAR